VFLPLAPATLAENLYRVPVVARAAIASLVSARWGFLWPLAALVAALAWRRGPLAPFGWVPGLAAVYLGLAGLSYLFSAYVPFEQHVAASIDRLIAPLAALTVVWLATAGERRPAA
jgi:hypothetical protein